MEERGYSRRDFLKFCAFMSATLGVHSAGLSSIVRALESKPRPPVVWFHFQECTCCSESFIRSAHPIVSDIILDRISLDYSETLQAAAGHQAEEALRHTMEKYHGQYIMTVEGSVPTKDGGIYCTIGGRTALDIVREAGEGAAAIICWGSCASNGCIQAAKPNPTGAQPIHKVITNKPIINVPGCPPIAEVMAGVIVHMLTFDRLPQLDRLGRPKAFYSKRVHDSCYRRPFFDAGLFVESWDDENARKGYCLYKMGCRGPMTYNACGVMRWNGGVSYPIQSGHGCIGCSEGSFWDNGPFYRAVTLAGMAAHAVSTNIRKRKLIGDRIEAGRSERAKVEKAEEGGDE
jgi:hydrogenase small subunit